MFALTRVVQTFPSAQIPSRSGGLPVEVSLIAQLGHGSGNHLFQSVLARQKAHQSFIDELDEPSARLGGTDFDKGDPTSLYSFVVGAKGHPFHRHAGHRIFTAVSGSGGAQLRFSSASMAQIEADPHSFLRALQYIDIPPDCLFTVRFGGETWHQFAPLARNSLHPAFFALSCHTNELGGALPEPLKKRVLAGDASIPALTELLPSSVLDLLAPDALNPADVPTITLSLDAPPGALQNAMCKTARGSAGLIRGTWAKWARSSGFTSDNGNGRGVLQLERPPTGSMLLDQFGGERFHHEDTFALILPQGELAGTDATAMLSALLEGFLKNPPTGVSRLMAFRNVLVRPLGLRTSPLGCPVSSLLTGQDSEMFDDRYPVLGQQISSDGRRAQVVLGADDKHLLFRSCVGAQLIEGVQVEITLGTRVRCKNLFGRLYMAAIDRTHRSYIAPAMLRLAAEHAARRQPSAATAAWMQPAPVS